MRHGRTVEDGPAIPIVSEMGPFGLVPAWVLSYDLSSAEFKVYISIRSFANADRECWPTTRAIADRANVAKGTVRNAIQKFRRLGLIATEDRYRPDGSFGGYRYILADINPALIDSSPMEREAKRKDRARAMAKSRAGTSGDVPATKLDKDTQTAPIAGTSSSAPPYTNQCTPGTPTDAPIEETKELDLRRDQNPPTPRATAPAGTPPAEPTAKAGGGNPEQTKPDLLAAAIAQAATIRRGDPGWAENKIADAVAEALAQGRPEPLIVAGIIDLARGAHGPTTYPRRLLSPGPWWDKFIPAPVPDRSRMCRTHQGEPADNCGRCASERLGVADDDEGPALRAADARAAIRATIGTAKRPAERRRRINA